MSAERICFDMADQVSKSVRKNNPHRIPSLSGLRGISRRKAATLRPTAVEKATPTTSKKLGGTKDRWWGQVGWRSTATAVHIAQS